MPINDPTDFEVWFEKNKQEVQDKYCKLHKPRVKKYAMVIWKTEIQAED